MCCPTALPLLQDINTHPKMSASYPLIIIFQFQHNLRDAATQAVYFMYLQEKFQWPNPTATTIQWQILQLTLQHFMCHECKILTKFIHE